MCGRGHDVRVRHRVVIAREHLACHESREVRHVHHERRADLVGDLAHHAEVHEPRVRAVPGDEQQRLVLARTASNVVVVEEEGIRVDAVRAVAEQLAGDVGAEAVREVAPGLERHAEQRLVPELLTQPLPRVVVEVVDVARAESLELRRLHAL